jgi:hypothetical protein
LAATSTTACSASNASRSTVRSAPIPWSALSSPQ